MSLNGKAPVQPNKSSVPTEASNQPAQRPVNGGAPITPVRSSIADCEYDSEICFWSDYDDDDIVLQVMFNQQVGLMM